MKLNKILALALSGVMAVSMLAGCSDNGGKDDNDVIVTPSTGAAATLNDEQEKDKVTFTDASSANLQKATASLTTAELEALGVNIAAEDPDGAIVSVLKDLSDEKFTNTYNVFQNYANTDKKNTYSVVFGVSGALTMDAALEKIAADLDDSLQLAAAYKGNTYVYTYTGTVSTVTATSVDGTVSGHYIVLTITQSAKKAV